MVVEFPELQGVMGGHYLRLEGADEALWTAVRDHYRPVGFDGPVPDSEIGRLIGVADRLDTVAGLFAVGERPSGSKDPFGLRRAAQGDEAGAREVVVLDDGFQHRRLARDVDLVLIDRASLSATPAAVVGTIRQLPERPEVVAITDREDGELRAGLLAAGDVEIRVPHDRTARRKAVVFSSPTVLLPSLQPLKAAPVLQRLSIMPAYTPP